MTLLIFAEPNFGRTPSPRRPQGRQANESLPFDNLYFDPFRSDPRLRALLQRMNLG
jgi:hypothetical protein